MEHQRLAGETAPRTQVSSGDRAYFGCTLEWLSSANLDDVFARIVAASPFGDESAQRGAWRVELVQLQALAKTRGTGTVFFEFTIPRMGRRADVVLLRDDVIYVLEYKVGSADFDRAAITQVMGYALDLKNFHEGSHFARIVPVLVATEAVQRAVQLDWRGDVADVVLSNGKNLDEILKLVRVERPPIDPLAWLNARYRPTPTIIEAAQALYRGHKVEEISRSEAGAENLTTTTRYVAEVIDAAKRDNRKAICFITGVPGAGKTLAGLNIANSRMNARTAEHATFLSGNGPLVDVLREALVLDALRDVRQPPRTRRDEERRAAAFIQNIHHFRDEYLKDRDAPTERVVIFDEAQRAWTVDQTAKFMTSKRGQESFIQSEPEYLLSVMDRHKDWCVVICLVGGGQEINTGEAGVLEWLSAIEKHHRHWDVHLSPQLGRGETADPGAFGELVAATKAHQAGSLHLATSIRSFRAERLSEYVGALIDGEADACKGLLPSLSSYPLALTRDLTVARAWLQTHRRGPERMGLLASSNALRLKPHGVFVKASIEPGRWFLADSDDVRSSDALEDVATEFDVQGLELDWTCVCWDGNFRRRDDTWVPMTFRGSAWTGVSDENRKRYIANAYRVLLTRARQGMIIFVPEGDALDETRSASIYDPIVAFLMRCGLPLISWRELVNGTPSSRE